MTQMHLAWGGLNPRHIGPYVSAHNTTNKKTHRFIPNPHAAHHSNHLLQNKHTYLSTHPPPPPTMYRSRLICIFLNCCNIICYNLSAIHAFNDSAHRLLALAASLSTLHHIACCVVVAQVVAPESPRTILLRKQIQEASWRLLLNRALYLAQMKAMLPRGSGKRKNGAAQGIGSRTPSTPIAAAEPIKKAMRRWKSWNDIHHLTSTETGCSSNPPIELLQQMNENS